MMAAILLLLLTAAPAALAQAPAVFNVKDYGAVGNGVTLDRESINKAIGACAKAGGGTVYFPAGTYLTGTVRLESNVTLWIASGATLLGTKDLAQYEPAVKDSEGGPGGPGNNGFSRGMRGWYDALIVARGVHDVGIIGSGVIDGNGVGNPNGEQRIRGPHAVLFFDCQHITVRDVTIKNPGNYNLTLHRCEEVGVDGLTAHGGYDGINMMDVHNATISNCRLFTGDDSLSGRNWENVTVSNCILNSGCNAMRVGGHNILVSNCIIYGPAESWSPTSQRYPTESGFQAEGPVDNMVLSNLTMINVGTPLYVAMDTADSGDDLGIGRIIVNNLTVLGAGKTPIYISAPADAPVGSIILNNVRMTIRGGDNEEESEGEGYSPFSILQSYGVYARNVKRLELHDVRVGFDKADLRPALFAENIGVLDLDRFQAERAAGGSPSIQGAGISRLVLDGKQAGATQARVTNIEMPQNSAVTAEPFEIKVAVENLGAEGLASVPLQLGKEAVPRSVWLEAGEKADLAFVNLESPESGEVKVQAGELAKPLRMLPRAAGRTVSPPYQTFTFEGAPAAFKEFDKKTFYIRAGDDDPRVQHYISMQYGDQYGAIYLNHGLPSDGTVVVKMDNPDLRTGWGG